MGTWLLSSSFEMEEENAENCILGARIKKKKVKFFSCFRSNIPKSFCCGSLRKQRLNLLNSLEFQQARLCMHRKSCLLYAWTEASREPLRNRKSLFVINSPGICDFLHVILLLRCRAKQLLKKKQSEKQIVHQRGIIFLVDSSRSPATPIKSN